MKPVAHSGFISHTWGMFLGWIMLTMVYSITYDYSNKDADKKWLSLFTLPIDHNLRLTWFKKLRLVDPPNSDNVRVCSEHITEECFIFDNASCYGVQEDKKEARRHMLCQL